MSAPIALIHHAYRSWWKPRWQWIHDTDGGMRYGWHYWRWRADAVGYTSYLNQSRTWWQRERLPLMVRVVVAVAVGAPVAWLNDGSWWWWYPAGLLVWIYVVEAVDSAAARVLGLRGSCGDRDGTVGELHDSLPPDVWVELPEHGIRVKRVGDGAA